MTCYGKHVKRESAYKFVRKLDTAIQCFIRVVLIHELASFDNSVLQASKQTLQFFQQKKKENQQCLGQQSPFDKCQDTVYDNFS